MNLANNNLKDLPVEISQLKNLKTLILTGNPIEKSKIENLKTLLPGTEIYF
jgi:Leucine-rich repeat (LRR) protein